MRRRGVYPTPPHLTPPHPTTRYPTPPHPTIPHRIQLVPTPPHPTPPHPTLPHPTPPYPTPTHPTPPQVLLPRMEVLREALKGVRAAAIRADWDDVTAAASADAAKRDSATFGRFASILGDEAYTVLNLKSRYAGVMVRLGKVANGRPDPPDGALKEIDEAIGIVSDAIALVPAAVVKQVREYQRRKEGE